jgi:trans-aconitate methyltransferase
MSRSGQAQTWNPDTYARNARCVAELGQPVVALLAPSPGERILDLGCGDGALTARLAEVGVTVVGVDASPELIAAARARGLDARVMDGQRLSLDERFDAVFSNAALHWMPDAAAVALGVYQCLVPGGRFVGELGGHGNVAAIVTALVAVMGRRGLDGGAMLPWYFPTVDDYSELLQESGFEVVSIEMIPRPTPLPTGMLGWLATFGDPFFKHLPLDERAAATAEVCEMLRPALCDSRGRWMADYVRLRFAARRGA